MNKHDRIYTHVRVVHERNERNRTKDKDLGGMVSIPIPDDMVEHLLCAAFEGGVNHWAKLHEDHEPDAVKTEYRHQMPLYAGGWVELESVDGEEVGGATVWRLDATAVARGLHVFTNEQPRHFANVLLQEDDAETGDVFVQCCLFGKVVFG